MATSDSTTKRDQAINLVTQALDLGLKGRNRAALQFALEELQSNGTGELTDLHYKRLKPGNILADPKRPGLRLRANIGGSVWLYRYEVNGRQREYVIGYYPETSLEAARSTWAGLRPLRLQGIDLIELANWSAAEALPTAGGDLTVDALVELYSAWMQDNTKDWKRIERMLIADFCSLHGARSADSIIADDVKLVIRQVLPRGSRQAQKVLSAISKMYKVANALSQEWLDCPNPATGLTVEHKGDSGRSLTTKELKLFLGNMKATFSPTVADLLMLQLFTVCRVGEIAGLSWDEVDLEAGEINLPADRVKNGKAHKVYLSTQAAAILKARKPHAAISPFVFYSINDNSKPISPNYIAQALAGARLDLGIADITSHWLRHTGVTSLATLSYDKNIRDRITNHTDGSVDAIYNNHTFDAQAKEAWQQLADHYAEA